LAGPQGPPGDFWGEEAAIFAGFTTIPVPGDIDGRQNLHAACDAEFPGAHFCHLAEYGLATSTIAPPATGAWIDHSCIEAVTGNAITCQVEMASVDSGRWVFAHQQINCLGWTLMGAANQLGLVIRPQGTTTAVCNVARPVACCLSPYLETFRGLTSATFTGAVGGRHAMHAACAAEYAGSHLCHSSEYERAASTVALPAGGAWADASTVNDFTEYNGAMPQSGRLLVSSISANCENWTSPLINRSGMTVNTPAPALSGCNVARPLACCGE
jgi:hypothetical protein